MPAEHANVTALRGPLARRVGLACSLLGGTLSLLAVALPPPEDQSRKAHEIVDYFLHRMPRPWGAVLYRTPLSSAHSAAAARLAKMGRPVLPEIRKALEVVEARDDTGNEGAGYLLYAYTRIEGRRAYPLYRGMLDRVKSRVAGYALEVAIGDCLSLSSYRTSRFRFGPGRIGGADRLPDTVDRLLVAWIMGDASAFQSELSDPAKRAAAGLVEAESWTKARRQWLPAPAEGLPGFGYRFDLPGGLAAHVDSLSSFPDYSDRLGPRPEIATRFYKGKRWCATVNFRFVYLPPAPGRSGRYFIDNRNLPAVLRSLGPCLGQPTEGPQARSAVAEPARMAAGRSFRR